VEKNPRDPDGIYVERESSCARRPAGARAREEDRQKLGRELGYMMVGVSARGMQTMTKVPPNQHIQDLDIMERNSELTNLLRTGSE